MGILDMGASLLGANPAGAIKMIGAGVIVAALVGTGWYIHSLKTDITALEKERDALVVNNKIYKENNDILKDGNSKLVIACNNNELTIQKLVTERKDAQRAIDVLSATSALDKQVISKLNVRLADLMKDPKNDGIVSPDLRETVRDIQNSRGL